MMNWKINYWTLLFAFAVLTWGSTFMASCEQPEEKIVEAPAPIPPTQCALLEGLCEGIKPDSYLIPADTAALAINGFKGNFKFKVENEEGKKEKVKNLDVYSFHLRRCELQSMLCRMEEVEDNREGYGDVYANLAVRYVDLENKKGKKTGKSEKAITLVFSDAPPKTNEENEMVDFADGTQFFDFVDPCPPCGSNN